MDDNNYKLTKKEEIDYLAEKMTEVFAQFVKDKEEGNYAALEIRMTQLEEKYHSVNDKVALRNSFLRK